MILGAGGEVNPIAVAMLAVLAAAGVTALLLGRLRIAVIPGYLIAGALVGLLPSAFIGEADTIDDVAALATVVLMFGIGMHLDLQQFRKGAWRLLGVGVISTVATATAFTLIAASLGTGWRSATAIGMALSMSSTAVVLRILQQRRELNREHGRTAFTTLLIQDMLVIGMLAVLPAIAPSSGAEAEPASALSMVWGVLRTLIIVGLMLGIGRLVLPRLMLLAVRNSTGEVGLVLAAACALGAAGVAVWAELSPELGAFIAGFLLSNTPVRFQLSGQLTPIRDLFMAVFFTTVGLKLDLGAVVELWWLLLAVVPLTLAVKWGLISVSAWAFGAASTVSVRTGAALAQAGEFSLVVAGVAVTTGLLDDRENGVLVAVVVGTLIATPWVIRLGDRVGVAVRRVPPAPWTRVPASAMRGGGAAGTPAAAPAAEPGEEDADAAANGDEPDASDPETTEGDADDNSVAVCVRGPVIVAGYGPIGRHVATAFERRGAPVTIIEMNPTTVRTQATLGRSIVFGDVRNSEVLERAGVFDAEAVVLTIPDEDAMLSACKQIRQMRRDIYIAARANVLSKGLLARKLGADHVTVEEIATAESMADAVVQELDARDEAERD